MFCEILAKANGIGVATGTVQDRAPAKSVPRVEYAEYA